jgi:hypothetical protein
MFNAKPEMRSEQIRVQVGRLVMRVEGENWNAYYAIPNVMKARFGSAPFEPRSSINRSANTHSRT